MGVLLSEQRGSVLIVTLNRPDRLNALDGELIESLTDIWEAARNPAIRAVVLTGAGRGFCAGADLRQPEGSSARRGGLRGAYNPMVLAMTALQKPVVAALNGAVAGAGLGLALGADIRVATPSARFVPAFARLGVVPDNGTSWFAVRAMGYAAAFEWLSSGRELSASEALRLGLVVEVVEADALVERAVARAAALGAMPGLGVGLLKGLLNAALTNTLATQLELEAEVQMLAVADPERAAARARVAEQLETASAVSPTPARPAAVAEG